MFILQHSLKTRLVHFDFMVTLNLLFCLVNLLWGQNSPTKMAISHYGEFCPHNVLVYQATHTFPLFCHTNYCMMSRTFSHPH